MPKKQTKRTRRRPWAELMSEFWEVPGEVSAPIPVFLMRGRYELEITGARGIREYGQERIVLRMGKGLCVVTGKELELTDFQEAVLYVRGKIDRLSFEEAEEC